MPRYDSIVDRLPSLFRPERDEEGLLPRFIRAVADILNDVNRQATDVLQAHWFSYADLRLFSPYFDRGREVLGLPRQRLNDLVDLKNSAGIIGKLRNPAEPLSQYLREELPAAARQTLEEYDESEPPSTALQRVVIDGLSGIIASGGIFDAARFAHLTLSATTLLLIAQEPLGNDLVRLNQKLLEEAYPDEIVRPDFDSPYINDLGHLAAMLAISPWYQPPPLREEVEAYRSRVGRIIDLYRNGLGTTLALRGMAEAQLPPRLGEAPERRDSPLWLEEFVPLEKKTQAIETRGAPDQLVGPLMRWNMTNEGNWPVAPTIFVLGLAPEAGSIDAADRPVIELYQAGGGNPLLGIAYRGTIAESQTLRLRPAYASWIGLDNGIQRSQSLPSESRPANPTADGPWELVAGAPEEAVAAICYTFDRTLWVATNGEGAGTLWRYDGQNWTSTLTGLPEVHCLAEDGQYVLIGNRLGLLRMFLYPDDATTFEANSISALDDLEVHSVFKASDGYWWVGTSTGAARLVPAAQPDDVYDLEQSELQGLSVFAINEDTMGTLFFGTELGLFQHQRLAARWYWYEGAFFTDQEVDWEPFAPGTLPTDEQVHLPSVTSVHRGPDSSLWIGTENGLARYVAHSRRGATFRTMLEAFPDLDTGQIFAIEEDERGLVWFCTAGGLFRYDGSDLWQFQNEQWSPMGRADKLYDGGIVTDRGAWQFDRSLSQWRQWDEDVSDWVTPSLELRSLAGPGVRGVAWTDQVTADLGTGDEKTFTSSGAGSVSPADLVMRHKPEYIRIRDGGMPAIPRMPVGQSVWRYLSIEPAGLVEPADRPSWTSEGRLLPPPPDREAPHPGRYDVAAAPGVPAQAAPLTGFDDAVFAFNPSARVWFSWEPRKPSSVLVRLKKRFPAERIDPAVIDRVWQGVQQVRPAGIRALLAIEEDIVRGNIDGNAS